MAKRYVYKNTNNRLVNIRGYLFKEGQELESDVLINGFKEAVNNGFLELTERELEGEGLDATQAPQTGDTGKVKLIFHMGVDAENKEIIEEVEVDPNTPVDFTSISLEANKPLEGWFEDAEFTKPVNVGEAKAPKEGDLHFYGKYATPNNGDIPPVNPDPNGDAESAQESGQVTLSPLPPPATGDEPTTTGSKKK
jgi:hypothetical protein